jgi:putative ABC transport system substrate-binding protein
MVLYPSRTLWSTSRVIVLSAIIALITTNSVTFPAEAQTAKRIAIVSIDEEPSTQRTIKGIKKALGRSGFPIEYHETIFSGHSESDARAKSELSAFDPQLFITIGSYATKTISRAFTSKPIIFANVLNPMASGFVESMNHPGGRITGAALDIPPDIQFKYFQRVVGKITNMGVIYSPENENIIHHARIAAQSRGINLIPLKVESEKDVPQAIDSLCKISDALWSVADYTVYTPQSTRHIVLQTLRNRIPMMGFSQALLEAGGLFSLDFDFKDVGRQAGEIATRVLMGTSPGEISVRTPGVIYFKYNEKTAVQINLKIPDELLAVAKEVIK